MKVHQDGRVLTLKERVAFIDKVNFVMPDACMCFKSVDIKDLYHNHSGDIRRFYLISCSTKEPVYIDIFSFLCAGVLSVFRIVFIKHKGFGWMPMVCAMVQSKDYHPYKVTSTSCFQPIIMLTNEEKVS